MQHYVYVLANDGKPLMPTTRYHKVRKMLEEGKAVVVRSKPFTIRLTYEPDIREVQPVRASIGPGRTIV